MQPRNFAPHADPASSNRPISLSLVDAPSADSDSDAATATARRFFLQLLRARLLAIPQSRTSLRSVLDVVAAGQALLSAVTRQIQDLQNGCFPTSAAIVDDTQMEVVARMVLKATRTVVEVRFRVHADSTAAGSNVESRNDNEATSGVQARVVTTAKVIYGEELKEGRMGEFLAERTGGEVKGWADAARELEQRLIARGKRPRPGQE